MSGSSNGKRKAVALANVDDPNGAMRTAAGSLAPTPSASVALDAGHRRARRRSAMRVTFPTRGMLGSRHACRNRLSPNLQPAVAPQVIGISPIFGGSHG